MTKCLEKIKSLSNSLSTISHPVKETDLVLYTRGGLGPDFELFVMFITSQNNTITMEDLDHLLLAQEHRLAITS